MSTWLLQWDSYSRNELQHREMENNVFQALASNVVLKLAFGAVCDLKKVSDEKEALQLWPEMNAHSTAFPQTLQDVFPCPGKT